MLTNDQLWEVLGRLTTQLEGLSSEDRSYVYIKTSELSELLKALEEKLERPKEQDTYVVVAIPSSTLLQDKDIKVYFGEDLESILANYGNTVFNTYFFKRERSPNARMVAKKAYVVQHFVSSS